MTHKRQWFLPFVCVTLGGLVSWGCDATLGEGQFLCDPEVPGSCPTGWLCQSRGTGGDWRCYSTEEAYCGNGVRDGIGDAAEECDGTDFGGATCQDLYDRPGLIICREDCRVHCTECGNGRIEMLDEETGEECDDGNITDFDGCSAGCTLENCGDGDLREGLETCDDGNNIDGDGCSANCLSDETCGNGFLDVSTGEQCDDGNWRSSDGCSSTCLFELGAWTLWTSRFDDGRAAYDMVLDSQRHRIVLFGGRSMSGIVDETWEYDGLQWFEAAIDASGIPPARQFHAMAYDSSRQRTVLFGGVSGVGTFLADTWEYDGTSWVETSPAGPTPAIRRDHAMTYDTQRGRVVLFGGDDPANVPFGDTWEYDGTSWMETSPPSPSPRAQAGHKMVYDTFGMRVLYFGTGPIAGAPTELWAYDGSAWSQLAVGATEPGERYLSAVSFDTDRGVLVLQGGSDSNEVRLNDTWEYDGTLWHPIPTSVQPPGRERAPMVYFPLTQNMVMHGGFSKNSILPDTWEYDWDAVSGARWKEKINTAKPPTREGHAMAYDPRREVTVVFGGQDASTSIEPGTWEFNGHYWSKNNNILNEPPPRTGAQMVYDSSREVMVLYGGKNLVTDLFPLHPTWEYDGVDWTPVDTATTPPHRMLPAMAYDPTAGVIVMHGGNTGDLAFFGDTWIYDGTDWTQRTPSNAPSERGMHQMVFSPTYRQIVLFGGIHIFDRYTDTWLYDTAQNTWSQLLTPTSPSQRVFFGMVWNESRQNIMIYGGFDSRAAKNDTWELDGFSWRRLTPVSVPNAPPVPDMVYDIAQRQPMIFGGFSDETWMYRFGAPSVEQCDNGADDDDDNLSDCEDPDCALDAGCPSLHTFCVNTDGSTRCEEPRCGGYPCRAAGSDQHLGMVCMAGVCGCPYLEIEADCTNGQDDNCDGIVDCQDIDVCGNHPKCEVQEATCDDGFDNDGDWLVDCADNDCFGFSLCEEGFEVSCTDGFDNDGDGEIDCQDGDCVLAPECPPVPLF